MTTFIDLTEEIIDLTEEDNSYGHKTVTPKPKTVSTMNSSTGKLAKQRKRSRKRANKQSNHEPQTSTKRPKLASPEVIIVEVNPDIIDLISSQEGNEHDLEAYDQGNLLLSNTDNLEQDHLLASTSHGNSIHFGPSVDMTGPDVMSGENPVIELNSRQIKEENPEIATTNLDNNEQENMEIDSPYMDCINLMPSPRTMRLASEDQTGPDSMATTNSLVLKKSRTQLDDSNTVQVKSENASLTANVMQQYNSLLQNTENASQAYYAGISSRSIIRNPPFFYTKPLHEVLGGFANLTSIRLPQDVNALLSLGKMFTSPLAPSLTDYISIVRSNPEKDNTDHSLYLADYLKLNYSQILECLNKQDSPAARRLIKALEKTQNFLNNHKDLRVLESERGRCTVLMEQNEYNREIDHWVEKCTRDGIYLEITDTKYLERWKKVCHKKFERFHCDLLYNKHAALAAGLHEPYPNEIQKILDELKTPNRPFPCMYGHVKLHKEGTIVRPTINTQGWYSYGLEKVISHVLDKVVEPYLMKYYVRDITRTASVIRNTPVRYDYSFIKVEMIDMHTNIQQRDLISLVQKLVNTELFKKSSSINPNLLMRILQTRLEQMQMFVHNGKTYKQLRGLPQGACDTRTLTLIMLGYHITRHQYKIDPSPWFSKIFMYEDELLFYICDRTVNAFLTNLQRYTKLKFKVDKEYKFYGGRGQQSICGQPIKGILSFLDITIYRCEHTFLTTFHDTTPIRNGQMSHSIRNLPRNWKNAVLQGHFRRIFERVSNPFLLKELCLLEQQFRDFRFPHMLFYIINHYLKIYNRIMSDDERHYSHYSICNFGNMYERIFILRYFLEENFTPKLPPVANMTQSMAVARKRPNNACEDNWRAKRIKVNKMSQ